MVAGADLVIARPSMARGERAHELPLGSRRILHAPRDAASPRARPIATHIGARAALRDDSRSLAAIARRARGALVAHVGAAMTTQKSNAHRIGRIGMVA